MRRTGYSTWLALAALAVVTACAPAPPLQDHAVTGAGAEGSAELVSLEDEVDDSSTRHAGYYFPEPTSGEIYVARTETWPEASRARRIGFVTALTQQQLGFAYAPTFAIFAKGDEADKMIIVALGDLGFRSLYQARGVLAQLTAVSRTSQIFRDLGVEDYFTFFDLAKLLGFQLITVSDGESFAHQIDIR